MFGCIFKNLKAMAIGAAVLAALASPAAAAAADQGNWAQTGAATSVPYGWVDFCHRYDGECETGATAPKDVEMSAKAMRDLDRVNKWVNKNVTAVSDMDHWGVVDQWDYPSDGRGDCEDFALLKRHMLAELGYPLQALLMTVVKDQNGEGHAILTVRTDRGDYILDNLSEDVKLWKKTPYHFVKRQSQSDSNVWVMIGPSTSAPAYVSK